MYQFHEQTYQIAIATPVKALLVLHIGALASSKIFADGHCNHS